MGSIDDTARKIERDAANDIAHGLSNYDHVQQEVADIYHGDPKKFQAVLRFMANDSEYLRSMGLVSQYETKGNDITGIWFKKIPSPTPDGKLDSASLFMDTEGFRHFLTDPKEIQESQALADAIGNHRMADVQRYMSENASDPEKLQRIFDSMGILNLGAGLRFTYDSKAQTLTASYMDMTPPSQRTSPLPSVTIAGDVPDHNEGYHYSRFYQKHRPGEQFIEIPYDEP
jgi:hypothetical protein